ncbi:MAG: hypothetical protein ACYTEX_24710 [Planctomycetota bacterium]
MNRDKAKAILQGCSRDVLEAMALFVETGEVQGDWIGVDPVTDDSVWEDDVAQTLNGLAREIRALTEGDDQGHERIARPCD